jgi:hypothetical protein
VCMCVHTYFAVYSCVCMTAISVKFIGYCPCLALVPIMRSWRHWPTKQLLISHAFDTSHAPQLCALGVCVCVCASVEGEGGREREMGERKMMIPTILPLQVLHRGPSCVTLHLSLTHRIGGVAVPLPLVPGSILVGSLGAHCSQCSQYKNRCKSTIYFVLMKCVCTH